MHLDHGRRKLSGTGRPLLVSSVSRFRPRQYRCALGRKGYVPSSDLYSEGYQRPARAEPAIGDLFEMADAVRDVSTCVFVGQVEKVDGAGGMRHVDCDVADLTEAICSLVITKNLRDYGGCLRADLPGRDMRR